MNKTSTLLRRIWNSSYITFRHHAFPAPFIDYLQNSPSTQYTKLGNGLTIATEERKNCPNACVGLYIDAGPRYESPIENGLAHFIEHLVYKGTKCRTKHDLEVCMDGIGANFGSFTTREMVGYYARCLSPCVSMVIDLLSDCVFNNTFIKSEIEAQKCLVYAEMLEHDKDVNKVLYDFLHSAAFQGTPLAYTVMGPSSNLYSFESRTIELYVKKYFDPSRMVLVAVGGINHDQIVNLANCYLSYLNPVPNEDCNINRYTGSEIRYRDDSMPLGNVIIAVEGPSWCDDDNIVMEIAKYIVGSWDRSQLSGELLPWRVAQGASSGLCDAYKSFNINYKDTGLWGAHYIGDVFNLDNMVLLIQEEWMYLCNCITESEVQRAKNYLTTKILSDMQSSSKLCYDIGRWTLYNGCRPTLLERLTAIERVEARDVREVCTRYIYDKCPTIVSLGRVEGLSTYVKMRSGMYWLRV